MGNIIIICDDDVLTYSRCGDVLIFFTSIKIEIKRPNPSLMMMIRSGVIIYDPWIRSYCHNYFNFKKKNLNPKIIAE
jgi:hypothetical protein